MSNNSLRVHVRPRRGGFSLVEVVIALGIISFALIAIVGLILVGLGSMRDALTDTATSLILKDARERITQSPFTAGTLGPWYYDANGGYTGTTLSGTAVAAGTMPTYRVDVKVVTLLAANAPTNSNLLSSITTITWPVLPTGLVPATSSNIIKFPCYVTPVTGPMWQTVDPTFQPTMDL